jgi:hypothetical protein
MLLSVKDTPRRLGYPAASCPREAGITSLPLLDTEVSGLAKAEGLKELMQNWGYSVCPVEV